MISPADFPTKPIKCPNCGKGSHGNVQCWGACIGCGRPATAVADGFRGKPLGAVGICGPCYFRDGGYQADRVITHDGIPYIVVIAEPS